MRKLALGMAALACVLPCGGAFAMDATAAPPPVAAAAPPAAAAPETPAAAPAPPPAAAPTIIIPPGSILIPAGTLILVETTEPLDAGKVHAGDHFGLRLAEPIVIDGVAIIPAGATGVGEVIDARGAGIGGRPARLVLAGRYLESGGLRLNLQSLKLGGGGRDNSGVAVGAVIAIGVVGALIPGGSIAYHTGVRATAKISTAVIAPIPLATAEAAPAAATAAAAPSTTATPTTSPAAAAPATATPTAAPAAASPTGF